MNAQANAISCLALMLMVLLGCEDSTSKSPPIVKSNTGPNGQLPAGPKRVTADQLPEVDDYLGVALDDGRIRIAPPTGWDRGARSQQYLALFLKTGGVQIPRIVVNVEFSPLLLPGSRVTEDNLDQLVTAVADHLKRTEVSLLEPPLGIILGDNCFARYVSTAKYKRASVERQMLVTVYDGRMYTVELTVFSNQLFPQTRDVSYAVAAALQFVSSADPLERDAVDSDATDDPEGKETDSSNDEAIEESKGR